MTMKSSLAVTNLSGRTTKAAPEFRLFELDIETNPPKSVYSLESKRGKRFYLRSDIDNLCIAQRGLSLSVLQNIHADEMTRIEREEIHRLHWKCQRTHMVKTALADKVWEIWSGDPKYKYARETFAADVTKKKLQQWLCLTARHKPADLPWFLKRQFTGATTKASFAGMDQAWIGDMAAQLLTHMREVRGYSVRCVSWHQRRIEVELERTNMRDVAYRCDTCHLCHESNKYYWVGLAGFLVHMQVSHEEFWEDGSWMIV